MELIDKVMAMKPIIDDSMERPKQKSAIEKVSTAKLTCIDHDYSSDDYTTESSTCL